MVGVVNISNDITSLKPAGPIETKLNEDPLSGGGTKVCSTGLGHMTKMADTLMYSSNL